MFDLEHPKLQLEEFGFFTEKIDAAGRLASGPSRRLPSGASHPVERRRSAPPPPSTPRAVIAALTLAILATMALIGVAAWPRLFPTKELRSVTFTTIPPGATIEIEGRNAGTARNGTLVVDGLELGRAYPVVARLEGYQSKQGVVQPHDGDNQITFQLQPLGATVQLDSQPTGATVTVDGKPAGTTPLAIDTLAPGSTVTVVFAKTGYQDATTTINVPRSGESMRLVQPLQVSSDLARIHLTSDPPGAQVVLNGQPLAAVTTPADVLVQAGKPARFELTMPHHVPVMLDAFTPPPGADRIVKRGTLVAGATLHLAASVAGTVSVRGAPHCQDLQVPADCVLAPGSYATTFTGGSGTFGAHAKRVIRVAKRDLTETFELGFVVAGPGKQLEMPGGEVAHKIALEAGAHTVLVGDDKGTHNVKVRVTAGGTVTVN